MLFPAKKCGTLTSSDANSDEKGIEPEIMAFKLTGYKEKSDKWQYLRPWPGGPLNFILDCKFKQEHLMFQILLAFRIKILKLSKLSFMISLLKSFSFNFVNGIQTQIDSYIKMGNKNARSIKGVLYK